jgi:hypothetical protein
MKASAYGITAARATILAAVEMRRPNHSKSAAFGMVSLKLRK